MPGEAYDPSRHGILVVDDHRLIAELLAEMLEELGHKVCGIASTEEAAVAAAAELRPGLIIIDAGLGRGCGLAAMAEILRLDYVPHIFMSGDIRALAASQPNAVLLAKPFHCDDLQRGIHRAIHAAPPASTRQSE